MGVSTESMSEMNPEFELDEAGCLDAKVAKELPAVVCNVLSERGRAWKGRQSVLRMFAPALTTVGPGWVFDELLAHDEFRALWKISNLTLTFWG